MVTTSTMFGSSSTTSTLCPLAVTLTPRVSAPNLGAT
jgi:hypothetical protein